jgi:putative membrane protein
MIDYDPHAWTDHLFDIRGSMVRDIAGRVVLFAAWSGVVVLAQQELLRHEAGSLAINPVAHGLIGVALGLLLVFRTNASYDRFWEGRKQWGAMVNTTRNLARAASTLLAADPALAMRVMRWTIAFPYASLEHLRGRRGIGPTAGLLPADEVAPVSAAAHQPLAVCRRIGDLLMEARRRGLIGDYVQMTLDDNVRRLLDFIGACERIRGTPLPFAYVVHLRRCLLLYCGTLPFALLEPFGWADIPATTLIAYVLFGIEEIGVEVEDPFGLDDNDLPLERFCATMDRNVTEMLPPAPAPAALPPADHPADTTDAAPSAGPA